MRVFSYVIVRDRGGAPNLEPPLPTLAVCKPKIRLKANRDDLVLAFTGRSLGPEPHAVRWAGIVRERLTYDEYWNDPRFAAKKPGVAKHPDNLYRPNGIGLERVTKDTHGPKVAKTDLGGRHVLVFDRIWHFGPTIAILPARFGLRMVGGRRGHRVTEISSNQWRDLEKWLADNEPGSEAMEMLSLARQRKTASCSKH